MAHDRRTNKHDRHAAWPCVAQPPISLARQFRAGPLLAFLIDANGAVPLRFGVNYEAEYRLDKRESMDATGKIYIGIGIVVLIGMIVLFWFISKRCARGVLLGIGIGLWFLGHAISSPPIRELRLIGGLCTMSGFIGAILGLFDLFRKKAVEVPPVIPLKSEPPPLQQEKK